MKLEKIVWLVILVVVIQTLAIIYFANSFYTLSDSIQLNSLTIDSSIELERPIDRVYTEFQSAPQINIAEATLRQTIQQELSHYFNQKQIKTVINSPITQQQKSVSEPIQLQRVEEQLELMISQGDLSHSAIEKYSFNVSKLAPRDRTLALRRLAQAINSGQVKNAN